MSSLDAVRAVALSLPRSYEAEVRGGIRFRVGRIVYVGFGRDLNLMGFAFPKEERDALVAGDPATFLLPRPSDLRYQWVVARLDVLDDDEMEELVTEAWRMVVPKKVAAAHLGD